MIYLFTIASPGGAGIDWLAEVLTTEDSFCFHRLTTQLYPHMATEALDEWLNADVGGHDFETTQRRAILETYPEYFARHWERARYGQFIVGNSDHQVLGLLPGLALLWPQMKFILALRNGINCVQSHFDRRASIQSSAVAARERRWRAEDYFTLCCHRWSEEVGLMLRSRQWLSDRDSQLLEIRAESVASDLSELKKVWDWIGIGRWEELASRNVQRLRIMADPGASGSVPLSRPEAIWMGWDLSQREAFRQICSTSMEQVGYEMLD